MLIATHIDYKYFCLSTHGSLSCDTAGFFGQRIHIHILNTLYGYGNLSHEFVGLQCHLYWLSYSILTGVDVLETGVDIMMGFFLSKHSPVLAETS